MKNYIINATSALKNPGNEESLSKIAVDLTAISVAIPEINNIILRGGAAVDAISGIEPNDIDLFYTYLIHGHETKKCACHKIRNKIDKINFKYFGNKEIDLENAFEKEPRFDPIKRTVGLFSYHTEYNSQFAIDNNGQIWTNTEALHHYLNGKYEICYENFLPWSYFPHEGDSNNYWSFQAFILIRGIGYIVKRNLIPGEKFMRMFSEHSYLIDHGVKETGLERFQKYALTKIKTHDNFATFLEKHVDKKQWGKVLTSFTPLLEQCL